MQSGVIRGKSKLYFAYYGSFGYGKTYGKGIFHEFDQNHRVSVL